MTESLLNVLQSRTRRYSGDVERWRQLHKEADRCYRLEKLLLMGLRLFESIDSAERELRAVLKAGDSADASQQVELINQLWDWWLAPRADIESEIDRMEGLGYDVDNASEFRFRCETGRRRDQQDLIDIADIAEALLDDERVSHSDVSKTLDLEE